MESFFESIDINKILNEASRLNLGKGIVDDGPLLYGDMKTYQSEMEDVIGRLGWNIVTYLMDEDMMNLLQTPSIQIGLVDIPFHFFHKVKQGLDALAVRYGVDLQGVPAYKKWANHIKGVALQLGYEFLNLELRTKW